MNNICKIIMHDLMHKSMFMLIIYLQISMLAGLAESGALDLSSAYQSLVGVLGEHRDSYTLIYMGNWLTKHPLSPLPPLLHQIICDHRLQWWWHWSTWGTFGITNRGIHYTTTRHVRGWNTSFLVGGIMIHSIQTGRVEGKLVP